MKEKIRKILTVDRGVVYGDFPGLIADLELLINQEVEKRIAERMPTLEEAQNTAYNRCMGLHVNSHGEVSPEPDGVTYMIFIEGTEWFRSRLTKDNEQKMWRDIQERERELPE